MTLRLLAVTAAVLTIAVPAAAAAPSVTLVSKNPLALRGSSFGPGIVVTLTVRTQDGRIVRRMRTSRSGRFTARFTVAVDACNGAVAATILTTSGYRRDMRLAPRGQCAALQPTDPALLQPIDR